VRASSPAGGSFGAVVAASVHYMSHRQPYGSGYAPLTNANNGIELVHPHSWPLTALFLAGGFVCGLAVAVGFRLRHRQVLVARKQATDFSPAARGAELHSQGVHNGVSSTDQPRRRARG
jgi:hypothetical protein